MNSPQKPLEESTDNHLSGMDETTDPPNSISSTAKKWEIRLWGILILVFGLLNIRYFFDAPWGLFFILVGFGSLYFVSTAMLFVASITLFSLGVGSLIPLGRNTTVFGVFLIILSVVIFWRFTKHHRLEKYFKEEKVRSIDLGVHKPGQLLPWFGLVFGELSFIGVVSACIWLVIFKITNNFMHTPITWGVFIDLLHYVAILGFGVGFASILCRYPNKSASITGIVTSIFALLISAFFYFVGLKLT